MRTKERVRTVLTCTVSNERPRFRSCRRDGASTHVSVRLVLLPSRRNAPRAFPSHETCARVPRSDRRPRRRFVARTDEEMWKPWWKSGNPTHALHSCSSNVLTKPTWPWMVPGGHQQLYANHVPRAMHGFLVGKMAKECRLTTNARCGVECEKTREDGWDGLEFGVHPRTDFFLLW